MMFSGDTLCIGVWGSTTRKEEAGDVEQKITASQLNTLGCGIPRWLRGVSEGEKILCRGDVTGSSSHSMPAKQLQQPISLPIQDHIHATTCIQHASHIARYDRPMKKGDCSIVCVCVCVKLSALQQTSAEVRHA
jgi:hypothetical protein